jgi:hypothetical protein
MAICSCTQTSQTDLSKHNISGNIYSVSYKEYEANIVDGSIVPGELVRNSTTIYFDQDGMVLESNTHNRRGYLMNKSIYSYSDDLKIDKISAVTFRNGSSLDSYESTYSYKDNQLDIIKEYRNGELLMLKKHIYTDGELCKVSSYDKNDELIDYTEYKSYADNNPTEIVYVNNVEEKTTKIKYNNGLWVEMVITTPQDYSKISVERDKNGLPVKSSQCAFTVGEEYVFSPYYLGYKYEYDQNGNWIRRITTDITTDTPISITERNIEYYNL